MTSTFHEAIAAARAGDMTTAQTIAAGLVRDHPDDPNAWYLLSQLVDSDARRAAYLSKTLALAPDHPRARVEFDALPPALVDDLRPAARPEMAAEPVLDATAATAAADPPPPSLDDAAEMPEWLQPLEPESVTPIVTPAGVAPATGVPATTSAAQPRPPRAKQPAPARKNGGNQALSILLGLLALLTVVVLVFLVYLLFF